MNEQTQSSSPHATKRASWRRSWRFWLVALLAILLLGTVSGFLLLRPEMSRRAKEAILVQLQASTGGEVQIGDVEFYPGKIVANNVRFYDVGSKVDPFASINQVIVDFPILSSFDPNMKPTRLSFAGGQVHLRFDAAGNLLNKIQPEAVEADSFQLPIKRIRLQTIALKIEQEGRTTALLRDFNLKFLQSNDVIDFAGRAIAFNGWWQFDGAFDPNSEGDFNIHLQTDRGTTSAKELWALPFLPQIDESYVDFSGAAEVDLQFSYSPEKAERPFRYRVALKPEQIDLAIPIGGVYFTKFRGRVLIEDDLITATGVHADWIDGRVNVDGTFDYSATPLVGDLNIQCRNATIEKFPKMWSLPNYISGKLDAKGRLGLSVTESATGLDANAKGVLKELGVNGLLADESQVDIDLQQLLVPNSITPQNPVVAQGQLKLMPLVRGRPAAQLVSDFSQMIGQPSPEFAEQLSGRVNVRGELSMPLSTIDDWTTYYCRWTTEAASLSVQKFDFTNLRGQGSLERGIVLVDSVKAEINGGEAFCKATIDTNGDRLLDAELSVNDFQLQQLNDWVEGDQADIIGAMSANLRIGVEKTGQWRADGGMRSDQLIVGGNDLQNVTAEIVADARAIVVQNGSATNEDFDLSVPSAIIPLGDDAEVQLGATFRLENIDVAKQLAKNNTLVESLEIPEPLLLEGSIELNDEEIAGAGWLELLIVRGNGQLSQVAWKNATADDIRFSWSLQDGQFTIQNAVARALDGVLALETPVPLNDWRQIKDAKISFRTINLSQVAKLADSTRLLDGVANGILTLNELNLDRPAIDLEFDSSNVRTDSLRLTDLTGTASARDGQITIQSSGKLFDGSFRFDGQAPWGDVQKGQLAGNLKLQQADLRRLSIEAPRFADLQTLEGSFGGSFDFRFDDSGYLQGDGNFQAESVSWGNQSIVDSVKAKVFVDDSIVRVRGLDARLGGGSGSGRLTYDLLRRQPGTFEFNLNRFNLARLSRGGSDWDGLESRDSELRIFGKIGNSIVGRGRFGSRRIQAFGAEADSFRSDFQFRYEPRSRSGNIESSNFSMTVADGQVGGSVKYTWGSNPQLKLQAKLDRLNARRMLQSSSLKSTLRHGEVSGQLKLYGRNVRSFKDLQGSFRGTLKQAEAFRLPVLQDVARVVATGRVTNLPFDSEQLELTLSQGTLNVKQMSLNGDLAQLTLDGAIRPGQRLDLNVAVHIGQSETDQQISRLLSLGVAAGGGGVPLAVLAEVNDLLSERLIFIKVGGTLKRPRVKVQADRQLGQEVALFFLNNSFGSKIQLGNLR